MPADMIHRHEAGDIPECGRKEYCEVIQPSCTNHISGKHSNGVAGNRRNAVLKVAGEKYNQIDPAGIKAFDGFEYRF